MASRATLCTFPLFNQLFNHTLFEYGLERLNRRAFQKESGATFVALGFFFQRFDSEHLSSHIV